MKHMQKRSRFCIHRGACRTDISTVRTFQPCSVPLRATQPSVPAALCFVKSELEELGVLRRQLFPCGGGSREGASKGGLWSKSVHTTSGLDVLGVSHGVHEQLWSGGKGALWGSPHHDPCPKGQQTLSQGFLPEPA